MKKLLIFIAIITFSCAEQENISEKHSYDSLSMKRNSKTGFYIFNARRELQEELNGNVKTMKIKSFAPDEDDREEVFDFDTLGRVEKHTYIEYEVINGKENLIPIVETFLYYSDNKRLREQIKYGNEKQIKRELFLYSNGLRTHHYVLDLEDKLTERAEYSYDENDNILMIEQIDRNNYVWIEQYEYDSNNEKSKFIWIGPNKETTEILYDENRNKSRRKNLREENAVYEDLGKEEVITSDSTKKTIYKKRYQDIIREKVIETVYDKFENCISYKVYENGTLQKTVEIEVEYFESKK